MQKFKLGTLTAEAVKNNFKGTVERLFASGNAFSFTSILEHQHTGNSFHNELWLSN